LEKVTSYAASQASLGGGSVDGGWMDGRLVALAESKMPQILMGECPI